ncbi:hypothetical protein GWU57_15880 [Salmonella enterica]|nr:hypothetical protein [Salmonella enterica]EIS8546158.1 hypothetical protein [Salmonella enterica]EKY7250913.1 hypothetical protein [Salmonella enterica]EKY8254087.1 hypothetical protein [Salmonella enterica]ELE1320941.1 hypothetical protein [Salmonella enterica]
MFQAFPVDLEQGAEWCSLFQRDRSNVVCMTGVNGDAALKQAMLEAARLGANDGAKQARQDLLQDFSNRGQARRLLGV